MFRRVLSSSLNLSRFRLKTVESSSRFFSKAFSTNAPEIATTTSKSIGADAAKNLEEKEQHQDDISTDETGRSVSSSGGGGERLKPTYVETSSPETVYEFFKNIINSQRSVQSRHLLNKALKGVVGKNQYEFVDRYFEHWWKHWCRMLESADAFLVAGTVNDLGKINIGSSGGLSKKFDSKAFQFLESKFLANEKNNKMHVSIFFNGLGKLALTKPLITENLVSDKLVSKSIAILNDQEGTWSPFQVASFYTLFLNSLPFLNVVLNKSQLENVCSSLKSVFVDEKFPAIDGNFLEYNRRVKILFEFADTFVLWNINADKISDNIWNSWFDVAKKLLTAGLELNYPPLHRSQPADTSENKSYVPTKILCTDTVHLCTTMINVALKFGKIDTLMKMNEVYFKVLQKNLNAYGKDVAKLSKTLRRFQLHMAANRVLESNAATADVTIIDRVLAEQLAKKVESFNDFLRHQSPYEQQPMNAPRGSYGERMDDRQAFRRNDDDRFSRGRNMDEFSPRRSSYYDEDYRNF